MHHFLYLNRFQHWPNGFQQSEGHGAPFARPVGQADELIGVVHRHGYWRISWPFCQPCRQIRRICNDSVIARGAVVFRRNIFQQTEKFQFLEHKQTICFVFN